MRKVLLVIKVIFAPYIRERREGTKLFLEYYPNIFWGICALGVAIALTAVWFGLAVRDGIKAKTLTGAWEPLIILIFTYAAIKFGEYIVENALTHRADTPRMNMSSFKRGRLGAWLPTNHSFASIEWSPVVDEFRRKHILELYSEGSAQKKGLFPIVERLQEENQARHYRILSFGGAPYFIRVDPKGLPGDVERRNIVSRQLARTGWEQSSKRPEFKDSNPRAFLNDTIESQISFEEHHENNSSFNPMGLAIIELLPYVNFASHYDGTREKLNNFAKKFGEFQRDLENFNDELKDYVKKLPNKASPSMNDDIDSKVLSKFKNHSDNFLLSIEKNVSDEVKRNLEKAYDKYHFEALNASKLFRGLEKRFCIHDVHPLNVFFEGDECVLIYDYSWVDFFYLESSVAFAMHRFIRECIIREKVDEQKIKTEVSEMSQRFIERFNNGYGEEVLGEHFNQNLGNFILAANTTKFLSQVETRIEERDVPALMTEEQVWFELVKFANIVDEREAFV